MKIEKNTNGRVRSLATDFKQETKLLLISPDVHVTDAIKDSWYSGERGAFLNNLLNEAGLIRPQISFMSLTGTTNKANSPEGQRDIRNRKKDLWKELEMMHESGLTVVVGLGDAVMHFFGVDGNLAKNRGSVYEITKTWEGIVTDESSEPCDFILIPTFDIDLLMATRFHARGNVPAGNAQRLLMTIADFQKAYSFAYKEPYERPVENFILSPTMTDVCAYVDARIAANDLIAVDIETTALEPNEGEIVVLSLAHNTTDCISIPFLTNQVTINPNGPDIITVLRYWSEHDELVVRSELSRLFTHCKLLLQNAAFDVYWLKKHNFTLPWDNVKHDTMLLHHVIDPELPHNLGFITSVYGCTPYWKDDFKDRGCLITHMDRMTLRKYNCRDSIVLHQVLPALLADLSELGPETAALYENERVPLIRATSEMHSNGVLLSRPRLRRWKKHCLARKEELYRLLYEVGNLPPSFKINSGDHLRYFLYDVSIPAFKKLENFEKRRKGTKVYAELEELMTIKSLRPLAKHNYAGTKSYKTKKISVDSQGRLGLINHINNRLSKLSSLRVTDAHIAERESLEKLIQWLSIFNEYQKVAKIESTYTEFPVGRDGRVHASFWIHGTATGRLASRKPNMQNIPKRGFGAATRAVFVAAPGNCFVSFDYDNLEFGTLAYETKEPNFIEIFEKGLNVHDINTEKYFGVLPGSPAWKATREAAKIGQFGGVQYGGSARQILSQINLKVPDLGMTLSQYTRFIDNYLEGNPRFAEWRQEKEQDAFARQVRNAFGHVRNLYGNQKDLLKICYNTPCQGAAASIVNRACVNIMKAIDASAHPAKLVLQIHDQVIFEVPENRVKSLIELVHPILEAPIQFYERMVQFRTSPEVSRDLFGFKAVDINGNIEPQVQEILREQDSETYNYLEQPNNDEDYDAIDDIDEDNDDAISESE